MSNIIKGIRNLKGYTQEEIAKAIGIHQRTFCIKENNPDLFTVGEIKKIAEFLGVEEETFFKDKFAFEVN